MKLVIISTMNGFSWGGSEELWYETALYAHGQVHEVSVVVFENKPVHKKLIALQQMGIRIYFIGKQQVILPALWKRLLMKMFKKTVPLNYTNRFSFIHFLKADFILLSQGGTGDITYYPDLINFFEKLKLPYAVLNHHHNESGTLTTQQQKILIDLFKGAAKLFFVAHRNKEVLERQLAQTLSQAEIVKNPVNLSVQNFISWPQQPVPHFAVVARLDVNFKGQDILLQTLAADKWKSREFIFNLFGSGPHEEYLNNLIRFYGLENKVFLKGHVDDITKVWEQHHVHILPSHSEGTPLSLVEALLCGRPCLVTDVGDSALLIKDNVTGWLAFTSSVKALDEAVERAWLQQTNWQKMGLLAHEDAVNFIEMEPGKTLFEKLVHD